MTVRIGDYRITPAIEGRASEVQILPADRGQHRGPSISDLLIPATVERAGLTVLWLGVFVKRNPLT